MRIEDHPFFQSQEEENIDRLVSGAELVRFEPDETIFEEGSPSGLVYLVLEGTVEFSKQVEGDSFHPVSTSQAGEFFGEIGVITGEPRSLQAKAKTPVVLATLEKNEVEELIVRQSGPVAHTFRSVIDHLHNTTQHFMEEVLHQEKMVVVGNMANTLIHDFKNPFSCIRLAVEVLARKHHDDKTQALCGQIQQQIERMLDMAAGVSLYSSGEYEPTFTKIRLPEFMDRFRELNFPFFEDESVFVTIDVDDIEIEGEEGKLLRVLQNLIGNAIDAIPESGEIHIVGRGHGDHLVLSVRDNAGGIPEEIRDRFFEPFVTHGKRRGTGLGTAIVKSIVEAHGGTIEFETTTGEGTEFNIRLPVSQEVPTGQ